VNLFAEQLFDSLRIARDVFEVLRQEVNRPRLKRIKRYARAFMGKRREHQNGRRTRLHDVTHSRDAIHHWHLVIHGNHVWLERLRLLNGFPAIGSRTDYLDVRIG
jgi:hypothetical protein